MVVVLIFAICWLPYHVYFIYTYHNKEVVVKPYIQHVYLTFYWLAMANAMVNPAIYYGMNARYVNDTCLKKARKCTFVSISDSIGSRF